MTKKIDPIELALAKASAKNPQTPLTGLLPLGTGNTVQNSIVTTVTNAQFASKFGLFDSLARFDLTTPSDRWPIAVIGDYVQNTEVCANVDHIALAPANTSSLRYSRSTNFPCDANQRRGCWGEIQFGRAQQKGDWQFDYTRIFIEREAVLSNFDYSDIRQGSNVTEHRDDHLSGPWQRSNLLHGSDRTSAQFRHCVANAKLLEQLQLDVIYMF